MRAQRASRSPDLYKDIMSKFSYEIWSADRNGHLSKNMLLLLLDRQEMYMKETHLFEFLLYWARKECEYEGLTCNINNIQSCLHDSGALRKIRFLEMSPADFSKTVVPSCVLSQAECLALESLIYNKPVDAKDLACLSGFSLTRHPRHQISPVVRRCTRDISSGRRLSFENCLAQVNITPSARVLVHGFRIASRMSCDRLFNQVYREQLVALVKDEHGNILSQVDYMKKDIAFNTNQHLRLPRPVWFEPGVKYTLQCNYAAGLYPLLHYSELASAKGASFQFETRLDGRHVCCCFLNSICYSY
ncbi:unnamed protein product [Nesidiocoris tenuis]|uniref:BACK domain-containing protein n=1 Tax=Nesidiocoris tenuis TaxID=355587 RepID=A0A6H5GR93_9HEMI|nr:unnamed protein product [Nesidiocoris tenuis]